MGAAFSLDEGRKRALLGFGGFRVLGGFRVFQVLGALRFFHHNAPAWIKDGATSYLELDGLGGSLTHTTQHRGLCILTVRIEHRNEAPCYQVINVALHIGQSLWRNACRNDGMVVGHLR